jgi:hypothetical protein
VAVSSPYACYAGYGYGDLLLASESESVNSFVNRRKSLRRRIPIAAAIRIAGDQVERMGHGPAVLIRYNCAKLIPQVALLL